MPKSRQALTLLTSRPESVEIAVREMRPKILGVIFSQDVLLAVAAKCSELGGEGVEFRYRVVDDPMEIGDAFAKFELMLSELEKLGYARGSPAGRDGRDDPDAPGVRSGGDDARKDMVSGEPATVRRQGWNGEIETGPEETAASPCGLRSCLTRSRIWRSGT